MSTWTQEYVDARREYEDRVARRLQWLQDEGRRKAEELTAQMHADGTLPPDCRVEYVWDDDL